LQNLNPPGVDEKTFELESKFSLFLEEVGKPEMSKY